MKEVLWLSFTKTESPKVAVFIVELSVLVLSLSSAALPDSENTEAPLYTEYELVGSLSLQNVM